MSDCQITYIFKHLHTVNQCIRTYMSYITTMCHTVRLCVVPNKSYAEPSSDHSRLSKAQNRTPCRHNNETACCLLARTWMVHSVTQCTHFTKAFFTIRMQYDTPAYYVAKLSWPPCVGIYEISKCATAYAQILNRRGMWQVQIVRQLGTDYSFHCANVHENS